MKIIKELSYPSHKLTVFHWNGKYLLKFEQDGMEQTYKIDEMDLISPNDDIETILKEKSFLDHVNVTFREMHKNLSEVINNL